MSAEHLEIQINNALDLVQVISEDVEDNFIGSGVVDGAVKARATVTVSMLSVLHTYLKNICQEAIEHERTENF